MEKQFKSLISEKFIEELPFWEKIRACWISNQIHCNMNSSSKRETLIKKGINFSGDWTAEKGFFRYYLFHIINNYIPGKSILKRKDKNKGFSPDNCIIVDKPTKSKRGKKSKKELLIQRKNLLLT